MWRRLEQMRPRRQRILLPLRKRKKPNKFLSGLIYSWLVLAGVVCAGCGHNERRADLVILNGAEPESLDPAIVTGQPEMRVVLALFEGLARFDPQTGEAIPGLAERWKISPDGRIYTFHLRSNAVWSTSETITAEDVVYSWKRLLNP